MTPKIPLLSPKFLVPALRPSSGSSVTPFSIFGLAVDTLWPAMAMVMVTAITIWVMWGAKILSDVIK